jgi:hypothetical protein
MEESTKPRVRINAKQTSKGEWYLEVTAETDNVSESVMLLNKAIRDTISIFESEGRVIAK